eukprot:1658984-Rhodomonas_salina.2
MQGIRLSRDQISEAVTRHGLAQYLDFGLDGKLPSGDLRTPFDRPACEGPRAERMTVMHPKQHLDFEEKYWCRYAFTKRKKLKAEAKYDSTLFNVDAALSLRHDEYVQFRTEQLDGPTIEMQILKSEFDECMRDSIEHIKWARNYHEDNQFEGQPERIILRDITGERLDAFLAFCTDNGPEWSLGDEGEPPHPAKGERFCLPAELMAELVHSAGMNSTHARILSYKAHNADLLRMKRAGYSKVLKIPPRRHMDNLLRVAGVQYYNAVQMATTMDELDTAILFHYNFCLQFPVIITEQPAVDIHTSMSARSAYLERKMSARLGVMRRASMAEITQLQAPCQSPSAERRRAE